MEEIRIQAQAAVRELIGLAGLKEGDLLVVGCSSSEIVGARIGKGSSMEAAQAVYAGIAPALRETGILLASQCCEHLNRALIVERAEAEKLKEKRRKSREAALRCYYKKKRREAEKTQSA